MYHQTANTAIKAKYLNVISTYPMAGMRLLVYLALARAPPLVDLCPNIGLGGGGGLTDARTRKQSSHEHMGLYGTGLIGTGIA